MNSPKHRIISKQKSYTNDNFQVGVYEEVRHLDEIPFSSLRLEKSIHKGLFTDVRLVTVSSVVSGHGTVMVAKILNSKDCIKPIHFNYLHGICCVPPIM